jgi:tRNA 2-selenouridine synthase
VSNSSNIQSFIEKVKTGEVVLLDVRSPGEHAQGHIPGAISFPLLNDEERKEVGITYKQQGQQLAVQKGFDLVGKKFGDFAREALQLAEGKEIMLYCWRGGMRSNVMAWVLSLAGMKVTLLKGGYKAYRGRCLELFKEPWKMLLIAGKTGSGKSEILWEMEKRGASIIDLEGLAHHKGSAFGGLGQQPQNTQEQFENDLAWQLLDRKNQLIWLEDESRFIGKLRIPDDFYRSMAQAKLVEVSRSHQDRINRILIEYGHFPKELLEEKTRAVTKRMGGEQVKEALECLAANDMQGWLNPLLKYYDKTYVHTSDDRVKHCVAEYYITEMSMDEICERILHVATIQYG